MKFIVIGLGVYGEILSKRLTELGHEVVGADSSQERVNALAPDISGAICLDSRHESGITVLPLDKADAVIVAIGQDFAASVQTVALLKQLGVKRIIARGFDKLHIGVLQTLGVQTVTFPESLAAEELAESLTLSDLTSSYKIDVTHYIFEVDVPKVFVGHALQDLKLADYNLIVITIKTPKSHTVLLQSGTIMEVLDKFDTTTILKEGEILVLYGQVNDFNSFSKNYSS